jgi:hypothetical protein
MRYTLLLLILMCGCNSHNFTCVNPEDITNMYSTYVEEWKMECEKSFNEAEKEIFKKDDIPVVVDDTNPDPAKCVCKGTGIIVQGDGHKTVCPFHGKTAVAPQIKR